MGWLSGYSYYKKGSVNATTEGAQTNYQLELIVGESSGSSSVDVHCGGLCYDFPNDIRFTEEDGETKQDYWVDTGSLEGTTPNRKVSVWIEVASTPAFGSVDFYMYYSKSGDSSESEGDDTFELFDENWRLLSDQYDTSSYDGFGILIKTGDDTILHFYRVGSSHLVGGKIVKRTYTISTNSWSAASDVFDDPSYDCRDACGGIIGSNIFLFFTRYNSGADTYVDLGYIKSTDLTGTSWGSRVTLPTTANYRFNQHGHLVHVTGDTYMQPWYEHNGGGNWKVKIYKTIDAGANWSVISVYDGATKWGESGMENIGDNKMVMILRDNDGGYVGQSVSSDSGETWSTPVNTNLGGASGIKVPYTLYDSVTGDIIGLYLDRGDSKLKISKTNANTVYASASSWNTPEDLDTGFTWNGYGSIVKIGTGRYFLVYSKQVTNSDADIWGGEYPTKWSITGSPTSSGGAIHLNDDDAIIAKTAFGYNHAIVAKAKSDEQDIRFIMFADTIDLNCQNRLGITNSDITPDDFDRMSYFATKAGSSAPAAYTDASDFRNTYYKYQIKRISGQADFYQGDTHLGSHINALYLPSIDLYAKAIVWDTSQESTLDIAWIFVRKYVDPEPTWGGWGSQQCEGGERLQGIYFAKLGDTYLTNIEKDSFRITEELDKIPSFEMELANCADNRTAISLGITDVLRIYRRHCDEDLLMFTGIINGDAIEYLSLERLRIIGYASYIDLNWRFHKHLNTEDAENVERVYDYDGAYTEYTTEANTDAIDDVLLTFSDEDDAVYIGQGEQFFGVQVKYSTKGETYPIIVRRRACSTCQQVRYFPYGTLESWTKPVFEYSKGSSVWATLDVLDESRAFTQDPDTYYITIPHRPSDWAKETVNSKKKFWIRVRLTSDSYTTAPKLDRIKILNVDVFRVYYFDTAANTIMDEVLEGTEYSMDAVDVCPSDTISIVAEYETKLRFIAGIANALTWDDDGDKKAYQWWVDTDNKVHFKQRRGNTLGDITGELTILNNIKDYFNLSNRLHFLGNYDGLNQIKAVIENTDSQDTHEIRELAVPEERFNNYIPLKEAAQKAMSYTKAPLQKIAATVKTKYWLDEGFEVGDTVTLHKDEWNVVETAFQIVRADIGPRLTNVDMGISQEHLDGLKAGLQRRMDISGIRMHGSTSLLQFGPEEMNYERVDVSTVYPARMKFEIPSDTRYIHKITLSWKLGPYRADVTGGADSEGHDHTGVTSTSSAHDHGAATGAGGAHTPTELTKAHKHKINGTIPYELTGKWGYIGSSRYTYYEIGHKHIGTTTGSGSEHTHTNPNTNSESEHTHSVPSTDGPDATQDAYYTVDWGTSCTSGACVAALWKTAVASSSHKHPNTGVDTGKGSSHVHGQAATGGESIHTHAYNDTGIDTSYLGHHHLLCPVDPPLPAEPWYNHYLTNITFSEGTLWTSQDEDPAHAHTINYVSTHNDHTVTPKAGEALTVYTESAGSVDLDFGVTEIAAGTIMELIVNGETIASNYDGDQTDIIITGYTQTGSNTIEIQPKVSENSKGSVNMDGKGLVFLEARKF